MERTKRSEPLSTQVLRHSSTPAQKKNEYDGNTEVMISTGSTLLDLAISGGRLHGGGIPGGVLVEIFGPSGSGKTVLLCEIAGNIQRKKGEIMFHDPEARLNKQFAKQFDMEIKEENYHKPDTVTELFEAMRGWEPDNDAKGIIHGVFADSLAALSTDQEMEKDEGDKMGMRRAKEFSEQLRKTCRILAEKNYLMVCSNQIRENLDAGPYGQKYKSPGGEAIGFYSSIRLRTLKPEKIKDKVKVAGRDVTRVIGVRIEIEVFKNSVWKPFHTAPVTIIFDYGIDDIRENLQFLKENTGAKIYTLGDEKLAVSMEDAINIIEKNGMQTQLKNEVVALWEEIEHKFDSERKPKQR
jgi:recombination protein RecA